MSRKELHVLYNSLLSPNPLPPFAKVWEAYQRGLVVAQRHTGFSRGCCGTLFKPGDVTFRSLSDSGLPTWMTS
ncbi:MAG: hypothetical protein OXL96_13770 [Candidatus Poribacteria bacterium]|nr:hypothetical protein [Candidatus Poribacteria bacterium]